MNNTKTNQKNSILKQIIMSHSGVSSKRVCGIIGFAVTVFVLLYCTILEVQAPIMIETFIYAICLLLGIDSVTGIFKKFDKD